MAIYVFQKTLVWDANPSGTVRLLRNGRVTVRDWLTDDVLEVVQSASDGSVEVTTEDIGVIVLEAPSGFRSEPIVAPSLLTAAASLAVSEDAAVAALLSDPGSGTRGVADLAFAAALVGGKAPVRKDELRINVKDYGCVGNGVVNDTVNFQAAADAAIASGRELWVPAGTYLSDQILIQNVTDFRIHMEGRLKRRDNNPRNPLLYFKNVTGLRAGKIRTDGSAATNGLAQSDTVVYLVDEAKHDVKIEACTDVEIDLLDSKNPAGDSLYVMGSSTRLSFGRIVSVSTGSTGRNGVSLVSCSKVSIDSVVSIGTGCKDGVVAMPGGFDIEPNSGQEVTDVTVGKIYAETSGTCGFSLFGAYTGSGTLGAGVKQIRRISVGEVILVKTAGVKPASSDVPIRGCDGVYVGSIRHKTDAGNTNQALSIDDSVDVRIAADIPRNGNSPVSIGFNAAVDRLELRGRIGASGSHCITVYALSNSLIDMKLKNPANGSMLVSKSSTGASTNVVFRGDWRFDTTGSWAMNIAGAVTDWLVDGADFTGWPTNQRIRGSGSGNPQDVQRRNVKGLTTGVGPPGFDSWPQGCFIENTAPVEAGVAGSKYVVRGWLCVVSGTPGTWVQSRTLTGN